MESHQPGPDHPPSDSLGGRGDGSVTSDTAVAAIVAVIPTCTNVGLASAPPKHPQDCSGLRVAKATITNPVKPPNNAAALHSDALFVVVSIAAPVTTSTNPRTRTPTASNGRPISTIDTARSARTVGSGRQNL